MAEYTVKDLKNLIKEYKNKSKFSYAGLKKDQLIDLATQLNILPMTDISDLKKDTFGYHGIKKTDPKTLLKMINKHNEPKEIIPCSRDKLLNEMFKLKGTISRNKGRYEGSKDEDMKKEYYKLWKDAYKKLVPVVAKLKKIDSQ